MIGQEISHYRVLERLGGGGMGEVFKAEDLRLERRVALKFLPPELAKDPVAKERFMQEAKAASALDHPNICTLYDIDETEEGRLFLAMASYDGETLAERLAAGPLTVDEALEIAEQVTEGLVAAHGRGIVHRDIKPANLMITRRDVVKILDFGLAKLAERPGLTKTGTSVGTPAYMSPEQARGEEVDHRTDLWSLGVVLWEMLAGRRPFQGTSHAETLHAILYDDPPELTSMREGIPDEARKLVATLLSRDPGKRPSTAREALELVRAARRSGAQEVRAPTLTWPGTEASETEPRRRLVWVLAAAAIVVIVGTGMWLFNSSDHPRAREEEALPSATAPVAAEDASPTVAVLPFANLSPDEDNAYFAAGVHEDILTHLSKIDELTVIARTAVLQYQEGEKSVREIAAELDADAVLEGSVRRAGDQIRITAQLIDPSTQGHLWAETYDRRLDDVFAVQTEIARSVAQSLEATLSPAQENRLARRPTESLAAYDLYLEGREALHRAGEEANRESISLFRKALEIDPEYALAWAGLADALAEKAAHYGEVERWAQAALEAARRAVAIDSHLAEVHTALGNAYHVEGRKEEALEAYLEAIEIAPDHWTALDKVGVIYYGFGRFDESIRILRRAARLAPNETGPRFTLAHTYKFLGLDEAAKEWMESILVLEPDHVGARLLRPQFALYDGDRERVVALCKEIVRDAPEDPLAWIGSAGLAYGARAWDHVVEWARKGLEMLPESELWYFHDVRTLLGVALLRSDRREEGVEVLREAMARHERMVELGEEEDYEPFWHLAAIHAALGNHDAALTHFERAYERGFRFPRWPPLDPAFDEIRQNPRYREILADIGEHAAEMRDLVIREERAADIR